MKHAALLRGVNVGGKNLLPMKELAALFAAAGCTDIQTYIQSGNVIFTAPAPLLKKLPAEITAAIAGRFGFRVPITLRSAQQLARIALNNPFLKAGAPEKALHVSFLADLPASAAIALLDPHRSPPDAFQVIESEIYFHMPNGMGKTKLTSAYFDSKLSTIGTARNWATLRKLIELTSY